MINIEQIMPLSYWIVLIGVLTIPPYFIIYLQSKKLVKFQKAYLSLQTHLEGNSVDQLLKQNLEEVNKATESLQEIECRLKTVESKLRSSVDRVELIRFNAFENVGSDLSFALAMLNQDGNGVVISSINNRDESRVYAKPIVNGGSTYNLFKEEKEAILKARETIKV